MDLPLPEEGVTRRRNSREALCRVSRCNEQHVEKAIQYLMLRSIARCGFTIDFKNKDVKFGYSMVQSDCDI